MLSQRGFKLGFNKDCHQGTLINDNTVRGSKFETTGAETVATEAAEQSWQVFGAYCFLAF